MAFTQSLPCNYFSYTTKKRSYSSAGLFPAPPPYEGLRLDSPRSVGLEARVGERLGNHEYIQAVFCEQ